MARMAKCGRSGGDWIKKNSSECWVQLPAKNLRQIGLISTRRNGRMNERTRAHGAVEVPVRRRVGRGDPQPGQVPSPGDHLDAGDRQADHGDAAGGGRAEITGGGAGSGPGDVRILRPAPPLDPSSAWDGGADRGLAARARARGAPGAAYEAPQRTGTRTTAGTGEGEIKASANLDFRFLNADWRMRWIR